MNAFLNRMESLLGGEFEEFLRRYEGENFRGLRVNTLKCSPQRLKELLGIPLEPTPFCPNGFYIPADVQSLGNHPLHHCGAFYIQEPSATSAVEMLGVEEGDFVLDLCAAPGGKSTQIGAKLNRTGLLWSNEIVRGRVLVDAPCSGEGMFRRNSEAQTEWSEEHVRSCAERQLHILDSAKKALKPGGVMVYSTCTFSREENEGVMERFLAENPDFHLEDAGVSFGRPAMEHARRIFPMDGGEGHFAARLRKSGESLPTDFRSAAGKADSEILSFYDSLFEDRPFGENISVVKDKIYILPKNYFCDTKGLPILRAGVVLGEIVKRRFEPHHSAFTAARPEDCKNAVDLVVDSADIRAYLHGEEIAVSSALRGYTAVAVSGMTAGFGKASGGRLKNKYPKGLRTLQ